MDNTVLVVGAPAVDRLPSDLQRPGGLSRYRIGRAGSLINDHRRSIMCQQGQIVTLKSTGPDGRPLWAFRYRVDGRGSKRAQCGGFATRADAQRELDRVLARQRRLRGTGSPLTLEELTREYLAQHETSPETISNLRWLLTKSNAAFGQRLLPDLSSREIAAWRITLPDGHRFEATQALRQVLARAVEWGLLDRNPAQVGVENPPPKPKEMTPFESWDELRDVARTIGPRYGPMIMFVAATGLRPGEWVALEHRDIDGDGRVVHVRRALRNGRIKTTKTDKARAVPLQQIALGALDQLPAPKRAGGHSLLFPATRGGYLQLHNWRPRTWRPAQREADIFPVRRVYDLRHTFATFALRAGLSTFDLSRYMDTSLVNIDRTYGHLAIDATEHAIELLDAHAQGQRSDVERVDVGGRFVDVADRVVLH